MKCWKPCCENEIKAFCKCNMPALFSCSNHFIEHIDIDTENPHTPSTLFKKPIKDTKMKLIHELEKSSIELTNFKNDLIDKVENKIQNLQNLLSKALRIIDELSSHQRMLISKFDSFEYISTLNPSSCEELLSLPIKKALIKLNKFPYSVKNLNFSIRDILAANSDIDLKIGNLNEMNSNEIVFFKHQTKTLINLDLASRKPSEIPLPLEESVYTTACSMCQIPNQGLFCYGNHPGSGNAFILYPDFSIKKLSKGFSSGGMSAGLYEDIIYLFGGWDPTGNPWNRAFKYSLQEDNWKEICNLKENISYITNVVTNEGILLTGYQTSKLYRYDIECDSYFELASFAPHSWKVLCSHYNRNFILESSSGNIYEMNPACISNWNIIGRFSPDLYSTTIPFKTVYNDSIYFLTEARDLYKFSIEDISLEKILITYNS